MLNSLIKLKLHFLFTLASVSNQLTYTNTADILLDKVFRPVIPMCSSSTSVVLMAMFFGMRTHTSFPEAM